jgi:hypothetical protein
MGDLLTEEEYLDILDTLPKDNQYLPDDDPNKFIAKMGAEAVHDMLPVSISISYHLTCGMPLPLKLPSNVRPMR